MLVRPWSDSTARAPCGMWAASAAAALIFHLCSRHVAVTSFAPSHATTAPSHTRTLTDSASLTLACAVQRPHLRLGAAKPSEAYEPGEQHRPYQPQPRPPARNGKHSLHSAQAPHLEELCPPGIRADCVCVPVLSFVGQKRNRIGTVFELLLPCIFFLILASTRNLLPQETKVAGTLIGKCFVNLACNQCQCRGVLLQLCLASRLSAHVLRFYQPIPGD